MIKKSLFISPTRERARDFAREYAGGGFLQTYTLQEFIYSIFNSSAENLPFRQADAMEENLLFREAVAGTSLSHFNFLRENYDSYYNTATAILRFFYLIKSSRKTIEDFNYTKSKERDLAGLFKKYEKIKKGRHIVDYADIQDNVLRNIRKGGALADYEKIFYDLFEKSGIHHWNTLIEKEIYDATASHPSAEPAPSPAADRLRSVTYNPVFSRYNELAEAARIVKSVLIDTGCDVKDIVIAAGNLDKYLPYVEQVFAGYGVPVFITKGIPIKHFPVYHHAVELLKKGKTPKEVMKSLADRYHAMRGILDDPDLAGIHSSTVNSLKALEHIIILLKKMIKLDIRKDDIAGFFGNATGGEAVYIKKPGIPVQELNQLVHRRFGHAVLLGVDSDNIPAVSSGNFLYSDRDLVSVFGQNNSWRMSEYYLDEIFRNCVNVHVVRARMEDTKKLTSSQILLDRIPGLEEHPRYEISEKIKYKVLNKEDLLTLPKPERVRLDDRCERFIGSLLSDEFTSFDGKLNRFSRQFTHFSASQFNTYATCPLKYFFSNVLYLKPPSSADGFEIMEMGSLAHKCFEKFSRGVMLGELKLPQSLDGKVKKAMLKIAGSAYGETIKTMGKEKERVYHRIQFHELARGLDGDVADGEEKGILLKFLEYVFDGNNDTGYRLGTIGAVECEFSYKDNDIDGIPVAGFIDRVDLPEDRVVLIDYKPTKKVDAKIRKDLYEKLIGFKEFQLPLYSLLANRRFNSDGGKPIESFLLTFKGDKPEEFSRVIYHNGVFSFEIKNPGRKGTTATIENRDYEKNFKEAIRNIVKGINSGDFHFSLDEDSCEWCGFTVICRRSVLTKLVDNT